MAYTQEDVLDVAHGLIKCSVFFTAGPGWSRERRRDMEPDDVVKRQIHSLGNKHLFDFLQTSWVVISGRGVFAQHTWMHSTSDGAIEHFPPKQSSPAITLLAVVTSWPDCVGYCTVS